MVPVEPNRPQPQVEPPPGFMWRVPETGDQIEEEEDEDEEQTDEDCWC